MDNPRKLALLSLVKSDTQECFTNIEINTVLSRAALEKSDAALYTLLYLGVTENKIYLDHITPRINCLLIRLNILKLGKHQTVKETHRPCLFRFQ